jgi:hypothetical protein
MSQILQVMGVTIGPGGYFLNFTQYGLQINGTACVFRPNFALEDDIEPHACWLEASKRVPKWIPLGSPLSYTVTL